MRSILIISPDLEAGRMLELAFELEGWEAEHAATLKAQKDERIDVLLLDMIEGSNEFKSGVTKSAFEGTKIVAVAPRGESDTSVSEEMPRVDLVVRRPYNLTQLVKAASKLFE